MAQYQSFPGAPGGSLTLDKLKKLLLPDLAGRSFLDVGCNEGFFCGFAKFQGASRSVGVDHSAGFIARARQRFPDCEFHVSGWDELPQGPFDVILLASALHYADDQAALLHRLVEHLSPDGVLVVELGIVTSAKSEWVRVERGIDEREFPTMPKLREVLRDYAWKWMGPSVSQDGDPVARHVLHVSRRRPVAYLLMQPPAFGKTTIAKQLFPPAGMPIVSGDQQIGLVAQGKLPAPESLRRAITDGYSPYRIDQTIQRVFDEGHGEALVRLWSAKVGPRDFALDAYVPAHHHGLVQDTLLQLGYLPVQLQWPRVGPKLLPATSADGQAEAFYLSMADEACAVSPSASGDLTGFVDQVTLLDGVLAIRGWAITAEGRLPERMTVRFAGRTFVVDKFERTLRPDVQKHLGLAHALVGYRLEIDVGDIDGKSLAGGLLVFGEDTRGPALQLAGGVEERWASRA
jgi:SAM-dependent methyltransferase